MVMSTQMTDYLKSIDGNDKFVSKASAVLEKNEIAELSELLPRPMNKLDVLVANFGSVSGGLLNFLERFLAQVAADNPVSAVPGAPAGSAETFLPRIAAVESALQPKPEKPKVHVNIGTGIPKITLARLPQPCWPSTEAVDDLANKAARKAEKVGRSVFVYQDITTYLPEWCGGSWCGVDDSDDEGPSRKRAKVQMDPLLTAIALDKWALSVALNNQLSYGAALAHRDICLKVAVEARLEGRSRYLGAVYDEVVR